MTSLCNLEGLSISKWKKLKILDLCKYFLTKACNSLSRNGAKQIVKSNFVYLEELLLSNEGFIIRSVLA